jgi:hypothetical protein
MSEEWCVKVKEVVSKFDFSPLVSQLAALESDELSTTEKAHLAAMGAAEEICRKVVTGFKVENPEECTAEALQLTVLSALLGHQPIEIRAWRDLLDPDGIHAFNNCIPEDVLENLQKEAQRILDTGVALRPENQRHLENFIKGIFPVPIWTKSWRQWVSVNIACTLDPDYPENLLTGLRPENLTRATRNFLESCE